MSFAIYKYPIKISDVVLIRMPQGAKILCAQVQHEQVCLWASVNTELKDVGRLIRVVGTGHRYYEDFLRGYIGTVQQAGGQLVWHLFDQGEI